MAMLLTHLPLINNMQLNVIVIDMWDCIEPHFSYDPLRGSLSCHEWLDTLFLHWYEIIRLGSRGVQMMIKVFNLNTRSLSRPIYYSPLFEWMVVVSPEGRLRCSSWLHSLVVLFRPDLCVNDCDANECNFLVEHLLRNERKSVDSRRA